MPRKAVQYLLLAADCTCDHDLLGTSQANAARFCKQDNLLTQSQRPRALFHEGVCGASVCLSTELSFPRSVPFLKWSEEEVVLLVLLHKIIKQKKKKHQVWIDPC